MKTPAHKIKFVFHPDQPYVELRLDDPLRGLFAQAADQARIIYKNEEIRTYAESVSPRLLVEWGIGLDALDKLAYIPSNPIHLTPWEIHQALNLASSACLSLAVGWRENYASSRDHCHTRLHRSMPD